MTSIYGTLSDSSYFMQEEKLIWTIGHSTHSFEELLRMLKQCNIEVLLDIRSYPSSRKYPQFNKDSLRESLEINGIAYTHILKLGGRRKVTPSSKNIAWRHPAFRGYADYMDTPDFKEGIEQLKKIASERRTAFMCSEAVWWRCHRSLVSDYLKAEGWKVMHIMARGKTTEHPNSSAATIIDGTLHYDIPKVKEIKE